MKRKFCMLVVAVAACAGVLMADSPETSPLKSIPRTADGKPNLEGIWQAQSSAAADLQDHVASLNMLAGRSVVDGGTIPYQPWAAKKREENFNNRLKEDPLGKCYIPGVPRVMYLDFPFQIFQTPRAIGIAFEWELDYRLIHTNGSKHPEDIDMWMGDSRGRWEGDTLVVDVANINDKTWFDMAGDFHSDALHVVERYTMTDHDTIQYEATMEDSKVFTKPWTIRLAFHRRLDRDRLFEYSCQSEVEESNGDFTREDRTWYPGNGTKPAVFAKTEPYVSPNPPKPVPNFGRTPDGKPDFQGFYESNTGAANQGLERRERTGLTPAGRGVVVDPPDGILPMQPWAVEERVSRNLPERGYDDPTAHCFPAGVPRAMYVPAGIQMIQTRDYLFVMHERMSWRIIRIGNVQHLPDSMRLWQGDSIGHWEGDTLVVETTNLNGKTWLNEGGEIVSHAERVIEKFTPSGPDTLAYEATVFDPVVYTRPWTIAFPIVRKNFDIGEAACHEEDHDLPHLKMLKEAAAKKK